MATSDARVVESWLVRATWRQVLRQSGVTRSVSIVFSLSETTPTSHGKASATGKSGPDCGVAKKRKQNPAKKMSEKVLTTSGHCAKIKGVILDTRQIVKEDKMPKRRLWQPGEVVTESRRIIKRGRSYYLSLPPEFVARNNLQHGDKVGVIADHFLKAIPISEMRE